MLKTNIKVNIDDIGGKVAKEDERYVVKDNSFGNKLILSSTLLEPNKNFVYIIDYITAKSKYFFLKVFNEK